MRTSLRCIRVCAHVLCVESGCEAAANSLPVLVPNKLGACSPQHPGQGQVTEVGAIIYIVKLIANSLGVKKMALAKVTREGRPGKPAMLLGQSKQINPELHYCPEPSNIHRQLIVRLKANLVGAAKPMMILYVHNFAPLEGAVLGHTCKPSQTLWRL